MTSKKKGKQNGNQEHLGTMIGIHNCWVCGKLLIKFTEIVPFHCSETCQKLCPTWNYKPTPHKEGEEEESTNEQMVEVEDENSEEASLGQTEKLGRICGICKQRGTGHNARTCPNKKGNNDDKAN